MTALSSVTRSLTLSSYSALVNSQWVTDEKIENCYICHCSSHLASDFSQHQPVSAAVPYVSLFYHDTSVSKIEIYQQDSEASVSDTESDSEN